MGEGCISHLVREAEPAAAHLDADIAIDPERVKARVERDEALEWVKEPPPEGL